MTLRLRTVALFFLAACSLIRVLSAQISYPPSPHAHVTVEQGSLEGSEPAPNVLAYLGIPYAKPPVGPLRWQPPQPADHWQGVRSATRHGSPCAQQDQGWNRGLPERGREDCLFLNVWTPANAHDLPVMVYIHGGGNVAGTASEDVSNGLKLVAHGVLLVTFDYRLGIFGFFHTPELEQESPHHAAGDYALLDQIAALQWVQRNIAQFGGDPAKVTIFGQSAGGVDTGLMMASPLGRGLFRAAVEESGQVLGLMPTATREESVNAWLPVARQLGPDLAAQRRATTAEVLAAEKQAPPPPVVQWWGWRGASVDGWVLPEEPWRIFAEGHEAPVPLVIGSNVQEIVPGNQPQDQLRHAMEQTVGREEAARLLGLYTLPSAELGNPSARWATDHDFRCAVRQVAAWHASHGFPTFVYQFDRPLPGNRIAFHTSELFYLFDFFPGAERPSAEDEQVSENVESYWTSFTRTGAPEGTLHWPRFSPAGSGPYLEFPVHGTTPVLLTGFGGEACRIIEHSYPK